MTKQPEKDNSNKVAIFCRSSTNSTDDTGSTNDSPTTSNGGRTSMRLLRIAVGTTNPCKIDAVTKAIQQSIESTTGSIDIVDIDLQGFSVDSSVPDQPFGDVRAVLCCVLWFLLLLFVYCCCCLFLLCCACACTKSHRVPLSSLLFFMYISVSIGTNNKWC